MEDLLYSGKTPFLLPSTIIQRIILMLPSSARRKVVGGLRVSMDTRKPASIKNLDDCGLMDLGYRGPKFTWFRRNGEEAGIFERLDRGVANPAWINTFHEGYGWAQKGAKQLLETHGMRRKEVEIWKTSLSVFSYVLGI